MPLRSLSQCYASFHLPSFTIKSLSLSLPRLRFSYILHNIYIASIHNQKHIFLTGVLTWLLSCYSNHTVATPLFFKCIYSQIGSLLRKYTKQAKCCFIQQSWVHLFQVITFICKHCIHQLVRTLKVLTLLCQVPSCISYLLGQVHGKSVDILAVVTVALLVTGTCRVGLAGCVRMFDQIRTWDVWRIIQNIELTQSSLLC